MATRRQIISTAVTLTGLAALPTSARAGVPAGAPPQRLPRRGRAATALDVLTAGNRRFAAGHARHPHEDPRRRAAVAGGQHPLACLLGCVDSRVPPELVFDQGLGDLLTVRTAGSVPDEAVLASLEYGVAELGIPLLVVLAHERCGAVSATVDSLRTGRPLPGHLASLAHHIAPAALAVRNDPGDWTQNAIRAHALAVHHRLRTDPAFTPARVRVVAAYFDLDTGRVTRLAG